jgi:hypothetical protein
MSKPSAIRTKASLIVCGVFLEEIWSRRVALEAVWQSLYLLSTVFLARKISSERTGNLPFFCGASGSYSAEFAGEVQYLVRFKAVAER